jgi:phosphate transport system permease protein
MASSIQRTGNPLRDPPWSWRELWPAALLWSGLGPVLAAVILAFLHGLTLANAPWIWPQGVFRWLVLSAFLSGGIFLGYLLHWSRSFRASLFVTVTACATCLAVAVLAWFLASLIRDGWTWFQNIQNAIQKRNAAFVERLRQFDQERQAEFGRLEKEEHQARQQLEEQIARLLQQAASPEEKAAAERKAKELRHDLEVRFQLLREHLKQNLDQRQQEIRKELEAKFQKRTSAVAALWRFLTSRPSDDPADTGILPALVGSFYMAMITLLVAVPIGVGAAIYLEEYARRTWLARVIEINLGNLAGVPSVVYGILGAYIFVELLFQPIVDERGRFTVQWLQQLTEWLFGPQARVAHRNTLGGGLTLAILTLPVIIVSAQEALRAVPVSIRHAALALGATRWQMISHHVLPYALPNILTGVILAISRVIGEAAPLVVFGAFLFLDFTPHLFSRFTVLPMQIYNWAMRPQLEWRYCAAMASLVLLALLLSLNAAAIFLRQRGQRRYRW